MVDFCARNQELAAPNVKKQGEIPGQNSTGNTGGTNNGEFP